MADSDESTAAAVPSPGRNPTQPQIAPSASTPPAQDRPQPNGQSQKKKKTKAKRVTEGGNMQADGAVSDSVLPAAARAKKVDKQRQQSVALPLHSAQAAKANLQKQRPVSVGGNMLPATPLKEQAYAGPTFQASPAASALPMPKFFSKSVPNVTKHSASLDARMAGQKTPEQESSPEPDVVSPQPPPRSAQQSPLDFFFNAQKAENQRKASASSQEIQPRQQAPSVTEPRSPFQHGGKSVFLRELDGDSDAMPSPKTVPPKQTDRDAYTQQLKDLLFNGNNGLATQNPAVTPPPAPRQDQQLHTPSPTQHRSTSGPSTPTPIAEQNNHYSLHYGNRNLSPLFKAARGDTPPARPSNLRQHSSASDNFPTLNGGQQHQQQQRPLDPNSFSRNYLDQHIRTSPPANMPNLPGVNMNGHVQQQPPQQRFYQSAPSSRPGSGPASGVSPRTSSNGGGAGRDLRSMEDDLRRMLKVNVLGN